MYTESNEAVQPHDFRICPHCGRPTPAQAPVCVNCGARSLQSVVLTERARTEERFIRAFFSRAAPLTYTILVFNFIVYGLLSVAAGGDVVARLVYGADPNTLIAFGAKTNFLLKNQHEWFRLVTPIFIHIGLIHLASNSYALWIIGPQVERLYGSARFMLIYLLTGVGGVVGSYLGHYSSQGVPSNVPSAGASGALFGLFGVLAVFGYKYRHELPPAFRRAFGAGVFPVIAINLFIGFTVPFIDNSAHIGGLVTGALLGLLLPYLAPGKERISPLGLAILAVCAGVVAYSFVRAYRQSPPYLAQRERSGQSLATSRSAAALRGYVDKVNNANQAMLKALDSYSVRARPDSRQQAVEQLSRAADELEATPMPDERASSIGQDLVRVLRKQQAIMSTPPPATEAADLQANINAFNQVNGRFKEWLTRYGYREAVRGEK